MHRYLIHPEVASFRERLICGLHSKERALISQTEMQQKLKLTLFHAQIERKKTSFQPRNAFTAISLITWYFLEEILFFYFIRFFENSKLRQIKYYLSIYLFIYLSRWWWKNYFNSTLIFKIMPLSRLFFINKYWNGKIWWFTNIINWFNKKLSFEEIYILL